ncbi:MAG: cell surface protein [Bacteroidetes bacterium]|nr:MAG: cell surface protein [Bacteroidota bacterium]
MKKIGQRIISALFLMSPVLVSASGGPDAYGYTWITSADVGGPTYNWIDITSRPGVQTVTGLADDNSAAAMATIGFNFHYYWTDVTQMRIGSNGWLSFNSSASNIASCFPNIPTAGGAADNYLSVLMSDLNFTGVGNPGQVQYWTNSTDSFIISFINVPYWTVNAPGWTGSNTFQVILCNSDSSITYQYGAVSPFLANAGCNDMEVGIENSTGTIGLQVYTDAMPPSNYVIRFDYPNVVLLSIQDVLPEWNSNVDNLSEFIFQNAPATLRSNIKNSGNAAVTTTISLQALIRDDIPSTVYSAAGSLPLLAAGDDSLYTFPGAWTPASAGQYSYEVTTTCAQDINAGNNTTIIEYDVVNACAPSMNLSYVTGNTPSTSINWNGGANDDGAAVYFNPPVSPYTVSALQFYISSNAGNGYIASIYDDDGPNGAPGTVLFTTTVASASVITGAWNTVVVSPAVTLPSGGFYVAWFQGGTSIFLGSETTAPYSRRNYEILDGGWASLRYNDTRDLCIRTSISGFATLPLANFSSATTGPLDFDFTDSSTGLTTSWAWDFGDGNTSTLQNPSHTYAAQGIYNVCLISTSPCGSDTICQQVSACLALSANYSSSLNGSSVNFTDLSAGSPTSWFWDFGDGNNSTAQNPSHTYATNGTYNVCLVATTGCGSDTTCQNITICTPGAAAFTLLDSSGTVTFSDGSTGNPTTWSWDFGDGGNSNVQNPVYTYAISGTYNVCLVSDNGCGPDTTCQQVTICIPVIASFNSTDTLGTITLTDMSSGGATSWSWDFGDGGNSTLQNPVYTYSAPGVYNVCLIATSSCSADTFCQQMPIIITGIAGAENSVFSVYPNPVHGLLTIRFAQETEATDLVIYDMTGRVVLREKTTGGFTRVIDVHALPSGMYQLQLQHAGSNIRFVKE